ncbi:DUF3102 domain-containing protein [Leptolyngbya sp. NK1-12]|uniref:DUF3102 domain-containing protein n=1 Tax=Leptolyngbya sp. NK1-12 TaxID=2547451 RepID=A0AA96WKG6_9CYAN|nr:DUF3102 domain-containing protein [Leptolyngbya sp. NK1-12]
MVKKQRNSDNPAITTQFDYQVLPEAARAIVQQRTGEIRERLQRSAQDIWEIGQRLADVRAALKHGQFDAWLKAEFGWSRRTAYNFINVYETFQERANLAQIDIATSALYLLAAPSTPPDLREQYLQQAKSGKKVTYKELRDTIERERPGKATVEVLAAEAASPLETARKPEIVTLIRQGAATHHREPDPAKGNSTTTIDITAEPIGPTSTQPATGLQPGWYLLDQQHLLFCGDTASPDFHGLIPEAAFALAATAEDWDHDWLVEAAKTVTILPETTLQPGMIEQLITLFSQPQEIVIYPWLPDPDMLGIAHRLGRKVVAGDISPERCQQAIRAAGLPVVKIRL